MTGAGAIKLLPAAKHRLPVIAIFFIFFVSSSTAQLIRGKIMDSNTRQPVSFAVIIAGHSNRGTTADLDGNFELLLAPGTEDISIQLIGYEKKTIPLRELDTIKPVIIRLNPGGISLQEIVVRPKENPADDIIAKVIANKPKFDIGNLPHYICRTYAKTYFTFSDDTGSEKTSDGPSDTGETRLLKNAYLFFMESVTEKKYKYRNIMQEKVIASKVSGFKSAPFGAFASQLQSFTFYPDKIELLGVSYLNPLRKGTFKRYRFEIQDTVLKQNDTTILIRFYPRKNVKFRALQGVLYINKNQYVLANVLAGPSDDDSEGTGIVIQQLYERTDGVNWFPKQLNTEILFKSIGQGSGSTGKVLKGVSRMYISDANVDTVFRIRHKSISAYNEKGFDQKPESFWTQNRVDTLSAAEQKTYRVIDSIGARAQFDKKLKWFNAISSNQLQMGYLYLDLKRIIRLNEYEWIRLGAGIGTSDKLSRWISIGGYGGYGIKDAAWKYGVHARLNLDYRQNTFVLAEAAREVTETAGTSFLQETGNFFSTENLRNLLISKMDKTGTAKLSLNTALYNFIKAAVYFQVQQRESAFGFANARDQLLLNERKIFVLNETGMQIKIRPGEKFTESMGKLVSTGSKWPVLFMNLSKGLTNTIQGYTGDFEYTKIDIRIDQQVNFKVKGFFAYQLQGGKVFGSVPYSLQYNNKSSRDDNYAISVEKTFETMYLNEFISTEYLAVFLSVNSGKILRKRKKFNPEIELLHNYGIGRLNNRENLTNIELNDMRKGFSETGLRLKSIFTNNFTSFGAGVFYRYGRYASDNISKNIVYKLVISYSL